MAEKVGQPKPPGTPSGANLLGSMSIRGDLNIEKLADNGGSNWYHHPLAVHYVGQYDRTYFGYADGQVTDVYPTIAAYDHNLNKVVATFQLGALVNDDHDPCAIAVRGDGRLVAFYCGHNSDEIMRYRISTNPEDITSWGPEIQITSTNYVSYAQVFRTPSYMVVFWRSFDGSAGWWWNCAVSTNDGTTFGAEGHVFQFQDQGYIKGAMYVEAGRYDVYFGISHHPDRGVNDHNLYQAVVSLASGNVSTAFGGTTLGNIYTPSGLPIPIANCQKMYDWTVDGGKAWIWDTFPSTNLSGGMADMPFYLFTKTFNANDIRYMYADFSSVQEICKGGSTASSDPILNVSYSGGMCCAKELNRRGIIYISRQNANGNFVIEQWITPDLGKTWYSQPISSDENYVNFRPHAVLNAHPNFPVMWFRGAYKSWSHLGNPQQLWESYRTWPVGWMPKNDNDAREMREAGGVALHGMASVASPGTGGVQLPNIPCREVLIIARSANLGTVYVGMGAASSSNFGAQLGAREAVILKINDANQIYIDTDNANEGVSYFVGL